jgi:hypothetical protein
VDGVGVGAEELPTEPSGTSYIELAWLDARGLIVRDLHDTVIQDLIGIGPQLADTASTEPEASPDLVAQPDDTIRRLRLMVFDGSGTGPCPAPGRRACASARRGVRADGGTQLTGPRGSGTEKELGVRGGT